MYHILFCYGVFSFDQMSRIVMNMIALLFLPKFLIIPLRLS